MFCAMSAMGTSPLWLGEKPKTNYEKCQDITTEIYKRINITFAIKKLESKDVASDGTNDLSEPIDSNELSNGTDLFAYEKTDSLSSSVTLDDAFKNQKVINLNNNEEPKPRQKHRRAKKRFRKRVKKKPQRSPDTDCSSDEEPLSRMVGETKKRLKSKPGKADEAKGKPKAREKSETDDERPKDSKSSEELPEQVSKEYEYFAKVMEKVAPEDSDLDAVLMPALYPEVDIVEKKVGTAATDDVTYYTFADLVKAGPSTSPIPPEPNVAKPNNDILDLSTKIHINISTAEGASIAVVPDLAQECQANVGAERLGRKRAKRVEERKECEYCKLSFSGIRGLRRHLKTRCIARVSDAAQGQVKEYWCSECDYRCQSEVSLRRHVSVHNRNTAEKKYACNECDRRYTQRSTLRVHTLTHRGERPHRCRLCHKSFTRYDTWKRHQRVHTKVAVPVRATAHK